VGGLTRETHVKRERGGGGEKKEGGERKVESKVKEVGEGE